MARYAIHVGELPRACDYCARAYQPADTQCQSCGAPRLARPIARPRPSAYHSAQADAIRDGLIDVDRARTAEAPCLEITEYGDSFRRFTS